MAGKPKGRQPNLEQVPELTAKMVELIQRGCTARFAAELCGIPECVLYSWLRKGEKQGARKCYVTFSEAIKGAKRGFVLHHLNNIDRHSNQSWQTSAWVLERSLPGEFASAEVKMRHRLEEVEKALATIQHLAIDRGIIEGGTTNALQPEG